MSEVSHDAAVELEINGTPHQVTVPARMTLADLLRERLGFTGTHLGCEHGVCGACTVLIDGEAARACLLLVGQVHGAEVRTVEGLSETELSPLQTAFAEHRGLQCGFCTPGFLMLAESYLLTDREPDEHRIDDHLASNLCRCTGYGGIRQLVQELVATQDEPLE